MYFASKDFVHVSDVRALARVLADAEIRARALQNQDAPPVADGTGATTRDPQPDDRAPHEAEASRR